MREPLLRHGALDRGAESQTPPGLPGGSNPPGLIRGDPLSLKKPSDGLAAFALFEAKATQFAPNPGIHPLEVAPKCGQAIVLKPSREEVVEFSDHL